MQIKVLIIDDNANFCNQAKIYFKSRVSVQYNIIIETNGRKAIEVFKREQPHIVLLDVDLKLDDYGLNGFVICSQLSKTSEYTNRKFAIIMFSTIYISITNQIQGIELGAHDYVIKPIELPLLDTKIQRIYSLLAIKHQDSPLKDPINIGKHLTIYLSQRRVVVDDKEVDLTRLEFNVLAYLARSPGNICTRAALLEDVWEDNGGNGGNGDNKNSNYSPGVVDKTIHLIRKKLTFFSTTKNLSDEEQKQFDAVREYFIKSKKGVGFALRPGE